MGAVTEPPNLSIVTEYLSRFSKFLKGLNAYNYKIVICSPIDDLIAGVVCTGFCTDLGHVKS